MTTEQIGSIVAACIISAGGIGGIIVAVVMAQIIKDAFLRL